MIKAMSRYLSRYVAILFDELIVRLTGSTPALNKIQIHHCLQVALQGTTGHTWTKFLYIQPFLVVAHEIFTIDFVAHILIDLIHKKVCNKFMSLKKPYTPLQYSTDPDKLL